MLKHSYHARLSLWHLVLVVIILAVTLPAIARPDDPPRQILERTSARMLSALQTYRPLPQDDPRYLFILVNELLAPRVDMDTAARLALGRHWRTATPEQRRRFTSEFRTLLVRYYSLTLLEHVDLQKFPADVIEFLPARRAASRYPVRSRIHIPHHQPIEVDYAVHRVAGEWKIYDIRIDGVSLVSSYRAVFSGEIHRHGLDGLLNRLAEQNRRLLAV